MQFVVLDLLELDLGRRGRRTLGWSRGRRADGRAGRRRRRRGVARARSGWTRILVVATETDDSEKGRARKKRNGIGRIAVHGCLLFSIGSSAGKGTISA